MTKKNQRNSIADLARFDRAWVEAEAWPLTARVVFDEHVDDFSQLVRDLARELTGASLPARPVHEVHPITCYAAPSGAGLVIRAEADSYGLGRTTTRYELLVPGIAWVDTDECDDERIGIHSGAFELGATSTDAMQRTVAGLAAVYAARGITSYRRSDPSQDAREPEDEGLSEEDLALILRALGRVLDPRDPSWLLHNSGLVLTAHGVPRPISALDVAISVADFDWKAAARELAAQGFGPRPDLDPADCSDDDRFALLQHRQTGRNVKLQEHGRHDELWGPVRTRVLAGVAVRVPSPESEIALLTKMALHGKTGHLPRNLRRSTRQNLDDLLRAQRRSLDLDRLRSLLSEDERMFFQYRGVTAYFEDAWRRLTAN